MALFRWPIDIEEDDEQHHRAAAAAVAVADVLLGFRYLFEALRNPPR